ncbi:MAG: gamma-glutamyltransferase family protein [Bifidobacterium subtile]|jgi:gamma-glutamyltranspeptidase/glutathione hydrolase|nr:gamma-glutamyltransferase family protein [Bifidobacterium subtile]MCI1258594.1 gamma-glutamyltransferase family protein [Bifidobacterium subtile]
MFNPLSQHYPSRRFPLYAKDAMVNCSTPQASSAGIQVMLDGGNAFDAAVAAAAALTVVEPTSNGIGSDAFAIAWSAREQRLVGLNSSGPAPAGISIDRLLADGRDEAGHMPLLGWTPVTVPGAPAAWAALNGRYGNLSLSKDLAPAVSYARDGYACNPNLAKFWRRGAQRYAQHDDGGRFEEWFRVFAPGGMGPSAGDIVRLPDHADTLQSIGETNAQSFYQGELAHAIDRVSRAAGGYLRYEDLAAYHPQWVDPIRVNYHGYDVCEIPPNGQGIVALMALNILSNFDFVRKEDAETCHRQIEAVKMAFADAFEFVTDPDGRDMDIESYLSPVYGADRAARIGQGAEIRTLSTPADGGTVYLCCADGEGNMVSYIQSNYMGFGSGIVVDGTGIALQNRGADFSLDPKRANALAPGKRSYHTIIPGFLMKDGRPVGPFGVMGGYMQPQGHVQVAMNYIDFGLNPQQSLDAPRWKWDKASDVRMELGFDADIMHDLQERGHQVSISMESADFGRGQMIVRNDNGVLIGGTESRTDSNIACI